MGSHQYTLLVVLLVHYVLMPSMVTSTTCSSRCASTAHHVVHTCPDALAQIIPTCVYETDPAGTCLLSLTTDSSLVLDISIINPPEFVNRLGGYFQFNKNNATQRLLELQHPLDVETVYLNTNVTTMDIQLTVSCTNDVSVKTLVNISVSDLVQVTPRTIKWCHVKNGYNVMTPDIVISVVVLPCHFFSQTMESVTLNLTVVDDDDNGPSFSQAAADSTCLLPAFTASAHEEYIGPLTTHPSCMCVTDGDFVTNNDIVLSFLYGNPPDFNKFFAVDMFTNTINKTSNISSDDPREYTFIIQAKEKSAAGRSMVAVLSVGIEAGYPAVTMTEHKADESVKLVLQVLSVTVLVGFSIGFVILIWHRNRRVKPATKQAGTKQSVIECFKSNIIDEAHDAESKSPCAKQTEWTLESIDEEPEQM